MTDRSLPDDCHRWPRDPYRLLGLDRGADFRQARRAYVQLIRRFKPDQYPEHFQRIRAAFEFVQRHMADRGERQSESGDAAVQDPERGDAGRDPGDATPAKPWDGRRVPVREPAVEAAWKRGRRGQLDRAYAAMRSAMSQQPGAADGYIRLYWLLVADPALDRGRQPVDWLVEALRCSRLSGPAVELYRREIEQRLAVALSVSGESLLDCRATAARWLDILDFRWRALSYLQRWDRIVADLRRLGEHGYGKHDEIGWCRILFFAMDQLAWFAMRHPAQQAFEQCRREVERATHLQMRLEDCYDRMDMLCELVAGWRQLRSAADVPRAWVSLMPLSWTQNYDTVRPFLLPILKQIGEEPQAVLVAFDRIAARSSAIACHLGALLQRSRSDLGAFERRPRLSQQVQETASRFLLHSTGDYAHGRLDFLTFCLQEAIEPEMLGEAIDQMVGLRSEPVVSWADAVRRDGSLRFVYAGWRSFWG